MPLPLLLLLVLLGPGSRLSLGLPASLGDADEDDLGDYDDTYVTDPPEMLETTTGAGAPGPGPQATMGTLGQRGTHEPAAPEATTGATPSTELATSGIPVTPGPLATELDTTTPPITEAPSTEGAPSTELAAAKALPTEPLTTQRIATEAPTTEPPTAQRIATEAPTTEPPTTQTTATEALTTEPPTTQRIATEVLTMESLTTQTTATEALTTSPAATEALTTEPSTTETLSEEPATTKALSTAGQSTALLVPSDPRHGGATVAASNSSDASFKRGQSSRGLATPSPTRGPDYMPVKHCLLAILILALVATTFLVCTVVLAVRLSRRNHMYHVRSYSPTEMVCISSLLAEGAEAPAPMANGTLPAAKGLGLREGTGGDPCGDDLTLQSFLP